MQCPGPFDIQKVIEFEWPNREPSFLLKGISADDFQRTRTANDARFVNQDNKQLIMSFHSFVVRTPTATLLVDTCVGNHKERPALAEWHLQDRPYLNRLAQVGLSPEDIDFVCCTHLHADHVGWNTRLDNNRWVPTFPNARYLFARREVEFWEHFHNNDPDNPFKNSWLDSIVPVLEAGQVDLVDDGHEVTHGINIVPAPGHTPGNVVIELKDQNRRAIMSGDAIHHPVQIERPQWSSNFCLDPVQSAGTRMKLLQQLADEDIVLLPAHFAGPTAVKVVTDRLGFFYADA
jgi:glyoxylase-like metal-dependent hydrolase (beta-lactamase superfamily II)